MPAKRISKRTATSHNAAKRAANKKTVKQSPPRSTKAGAKRQKARLKSKRTAKAGGPVVL